MHDFRFYFDHESLDVTKEEFVNRALDLYIEDVEAQIEDEGEDYQKEYSGEKWYPTSLPMLGLEKFRNRRKRLLCSPLPAFWEKYVLSLKPFSFNDAFSAESVVVTFEQPPSLIDLALVQAKIGHDMNAELGIETFGYSIGAISLSGEYGILRVGFDEIAG